MTNYQTNAASNFNLKSEIQKSYIRTMLSHLDLFHGDATPNRAVLYARLPREGLPSDATLCGTVIGPECATAHTLPSKAALNDLGAGDTLLAAATIPDPVFWSAKLPARYRVKVELGSRGQVLASEERMVGIRAIGAVGSDLRQENKRMVLRMIHQGEAPQFKVSDWKDVSASMLAYSPSEELCEEASDQGLLMAVIPPRPNTDMVSQLRHYSRHAAVAITIIDGNLDTPAEVFRDAAPNMLLFQSISPSEQFRKPAAWAHGLMVPTIKPKQFAHWMGSCKLPILAARPHGPAEDLQSHRTACDALQRDLAPYCQCAGYIV